MNKVIKIIIPVISVLIIMNLAFYAFCEDYYKHKIPDEQIKLEISDLSVGDCNESHIEYENTWGYELPDNIRYNMDKYKVVSMSYHIKNNSDKIVMEDVRCHPKFQDAEVIAYNSGNGTYYIFIQPNNEWGFKQYIFINADNMSDTEIYNNIMNEKIEITLFTKNVLIGLFKRNTGHGWTGMGQYSYIFSIKDCLVE